MPLINSRDKQEYKDYSTTLKGNPINSDLFKAQLARIKIGKGNYTEAVYIEIKNTNIKMALFSDQQYYFPISKLFKESKEEFDIYIVDFLKLYLTAEQFINILNSIGTTKYNLGYETKRLEFVKLLKPTK